MTAIREVSSDGVTLALIVRASISPAATTFVTTPAHSLQLGFVVYPAGGEVRRHVHKPIERTITGTSEVLVVKQGRCEVDIYDDRRERVATEELAVGDVIVLIAGGHGFRMREDTVLLEVKQGPYTGISEKEHF